MGTFTNTFTNTFGSVTKGSLLNLLKFNWSQGYLNSSGNLINDVTLGPYYISTALVDLEIGTFLNISINPAYQYRIHRYNESGTFLSREDWYNENNTFYEVTSAKIAISVKADDGSVITPEDAFDIALKMWHNHKFIHFSIDDVHALWGNLVTNEATYNSIFDNATLSWVKSMHDNYGIVCTLILNYIEDLNTLPSKFASDFVVNKSWLKLGFQAKANRNYSTDDGTLANADYAEFIGYVNAKIGDVGVIDTVMRGNYFAGSLAACQAWRNAGVKGFLGADDARAVHYYLTQTQTDALHLRNRFYDASNDVTFFKTDFRFEQVAGRFTDISGAISYYEAEVTQNHDMIVFTHEYDVNTYKTDMETFFAWAKSKGYANIFPESKVAV